MENFSQQFLVDPETVFLNFGSYGACPRPVFEQYQAFQLELERNPVQFITVNGVEYLRQSREALGAYIGCAADEVVYVPNPTFGINIVARNLDLQPGDEVLSTDLEYGAMDRIWNYYCRPKGARYVRQPITLPLVSKEKFCEEFWRGFSPKTRAIFLGQLTSATALLLPVQEICEEAKRRGLLTIIDGAHVPGQVQLDLGKLPADIYTGACHKWMMTPKGSSFLYVKKEFQQWMDPLVVSWGYESQTPSDSQFLDYHQFNGTRDFSAYLCIPAAIEFMRTNQWDQVATHCRELAHANYQKFCDLFGTRPLAPISDDFLGQMCSVPVHTRDPAGWKNRLYQEFKIEIPVMEHNGKVYLRYSIQAFNSQHDLDRLYDAMKVILKSENR